jgi:hypothetical protein
VDCLLVQPIMSAAAGTSKRGSFRKLIRSSDVFVGIGLRCLG